MRGRPAGNAGTTPAATLLAQVHVVQAVAPHSDAGRAGSEAIQIPAVDEHPASAIGVTERQGEAALDVIQGRLAKQASLGQRFHRSVSRPGRYERYHGSAAAECRVHRAQKPVVLFAGGHERWGDQQEHTQRDVAARQCSRRVLELGQREALVQAIERRGMCGFQPHRHFERGRASRSYAVARQCVEQAVHARANQRRVRLHDDTREAGQRRGNLVVVLDRNGARIEETTGVIELDHAHARLFLVQGRDSGGDLRGDGAGRRIRERGVTPEIAHRAAPRTLASGQEHGGRAGARAFLRSLVFDDQALVLPGIM